MKNKGENTVYDFAIAAIKQAQPSSVTEANTEISE